MEAINRSYIARLLYDNGIDVYYIPRDATVDADTRIEQEQLDSLPNHLKIINNWPN